MRNDVTHFLWFNSRTILPEVEKCQEDPKRLKSMFDSRRVRFKTVYGKFCLNNPKSEYIINNHEKYFTVSYEFLVNWSQVPLSWVSTISCFYQRCTSDQWPTIRADVGGLGSP